MTGEKGQQPPSLQSLQVMVEAIMPDGVAARCRDANGDIGGLFAEERAAVAKAVARRQAEFAAGRSAARAALRQFGQAATPILAGPDRAPIWPTGFTGSISHCRSAVVAIAARAEVPARHFGVDVEEATGLEADLWDSICRPSEIGWFDARPNAALWAKTVFSIKEAVYKAQYPLTRRLIDFHDVEIVDFDPAGRFTAQVLTGDMEKVTGRFQVSNLFIVSFATAQGPER